MSDAFHASPESIATLLGSLRRERVIVPPYQRGYMWQEKHVKQFWHDIIRFQVKRPFKGEQDQYFLGPIVTLTRPKEEEAIHLLDGQQRLATATILLSVIRDLADEAQTEAGKNLARDIQNQLIQRGPNSFTLDLGETDRTYFRETVQMLPPTGRTATLRTHHNIKKARRTLMDLVRQRVGQPNTPGAIDALIALRQTLVSDLIMARIPVASERDAFQIFETLNDRGVKLQAPDLLLNFLMREAKDDDDRKAVREYWTEIVEEMGKFDINRFFRHVWVSKYGDLKDRDLFTALKEFVENQKLESAAFARSCASECERYVQILTVDEKFVPKDAISPLRRLIVELDVQAAMPLLIAAYGLLKPKHFEALVRYLLVFYARYSIISNLDRGDMEDLLFRLAREVRAMVSDSSDEKASANCASHAKRTLAAHAPADEASRTGAESLNFDEDASHAKYVVARLAEYIQSPTKEVGLKEANLEHIYPISPKSDEWGGEANQALLNEYLWHLGNLTIYGTRLNRVAGNAEFSVKRKQYEEKSSVKMTLDVAKSFANWDRDAIITRAKALAKKVVEVWSFDNPSRV